MFFEKNIPLEISIIALFSIPRGKLPQPIREQNSTEEKSTIARVQSSVARDKLKNSNKSSFANCPTARWTTKKPDSDNIIKIILDGLNGVCYHDDAQICRVIFEKKYAEIPETKITIMELKL